MSRLDDRTKSTFAKDIKFTTNLETFIFNLFLASTTTKNNIEVRNIRNNGISNSGEYIEKGQSTFGADYKVDLFYQGKKYNDLPLEVKWTPTYGKLTLKEYDIKAYQKEKAAILFLYTSKYINLKKPKDYELGSHKIKILNEIDNLMWGIMLPDKVNLILKDFKLQKIKYMGNKQGIIIPQSKFGNYFKEETI